jgi:hypothetical protein
MKAKKAKKAIEVREARKEDLNRRKKGGKEVCRVRRNCKKRNRTRETLHGDLGASVSGEAPKAYLDSMTKTLSADGKGENLLEPWQMTQEQQRAAELAYLKMQSHKAQQKEVRLKEAPAGRKKPGEVLDTKKRSKEVGDKPVKNTLKEKKVDKGVYL